MTQLLGMTLRLEMVVDRSERTWHLVSRLEKGTHAGLRETWCAKPSIAVRPEMLTSTPERTQRRGRQLEKGILVEPQMARGEEGTSKHIPRQMGIQMRTGLLKEALARRIPACNQHSLPLRPDLERLHRSCEICGSAKSMLKSTT